MNCSGYSRVSVMSPMRHTEYSMDIGPTTKCRGDRLMCAQIVYTYRIMMPASSTCTNCKYSIHVAVSVCASRPENSHKNRKNSQDTGFTDISRIYQ